MINTLFFGGTDIGSKRVCNEDYFKISNELRLAIVCDGMGGHESGDIASHLVAETVIDVFSRITENQMEWLVEFEPEDLPGSVKRFYVSAQIANARLLQQSEELRMTKGMGTTLVAIHYFKGYAIILHVGDSRCYRIRNNSINLLTQDHSFAQSLFNEGAISQQELENFEQKNVITRACGLAPQMKVDIAIHRVEENDIFLLCSDGLWNMVPDDKILARVDDNNDQLEKVPDLLIQDAIEAGGDDNITLVVMRNVRQGMVRDDLKENKWTLSPKDDEIIGRYNTVLWDLFGTKKKRIWPMIAIPAVLVICIGIWIFMLSNEVKPPPTTGAPSASEKMEKKLPKEKVHFALADGGNQNWLSGIVVVDGQKCGTLASLVENGFYFSLDFHKFQIVVDSLIVYSGEFQCTDSSRQNHVIVIGAK